MEQVSH